MKELLNVYGLDGNLIGTQDRHSFYNEIEEEFAKTGKITKKVSSIRLLLMNSEGRIYIQKRSKFKETNAGLYDKTVGGHVFSGHTIHMTVVRECAEELGFPAVVLTQEEFQPAIESTDLSVIGLFKEVATVPTFLSERTISGRKIVQPFMSTFFVGYYNGSIRFSDGEASGIETFSLEELGQDLRLNPSKYTFDLQYMLDHYSKHLTPVPSRLRTHSR